MKLGSMTAGLLSLICVTAQAATIFVVESYHQGYSWDAEYYQALQDNLGTKHEYILRSLDSKRKLPEEWHQTASDVVAEIKSSRPDLVIIGDDNAMQYVGLSIAAFGQPIVFLGINGTLDQYGIAASATMTGILERPFIIQSVRHVRKVLKDDRSILVLMDNSVTMQNSVSETFGDARTVNIQGSTVDFVLTNSADEWKTAISNAHEQYDAVLVGTYHTLRNDDQSYFSPESAMQFAQQSLKVPLFALWDFSVGQEMAAGGYVVSAYEEGKAASRMASLVLQGVPISSIVPSNSQSGHYIYSQKAMQHWDVRLSPLIASQTTFKE